MWAVLRTNPRRVREGNVAAVGSKSERQAARALVAAYHEARLADLIEHVAEELDRYRAGEVDAYPQTKRFINTTGPPKSSGSPAGLAASERILRLSRGA